jgi:hypothetical protein
MNLRSISLFSRRKALRLAGGAGLVSLGSAEAAKTGTSRLIDVDRPHADGEAPIPLQGPPIAMLLFALTRATSDPAKNQFMTAAQEKSLRANASSYDVFKGVGAGMIQVGNGIDVFKAFIDANPKYLATLQAAQAMYPDFKAFCTNAGFWDTACELKYTQLANIARTDWLSED